MFDIVDLPDAETLNLLVERYPQLAPPTLEDILNKISADVQQRPDSASAC